MNNINSKFLSFKVDVSASPLEAPKNIRLNSPRDSHTYENENAEHPAKEQSTHDIPQITIDDPDQNRTINYESSSTETEMSSSHRHHSGSSSSKTKHTS